MSEAAREAVGLVAGRGDYPLMFCRSARQHGVRRLVVTAIENEANREIEALADEVVWLHLGQVNKAINAYRERGIAEVVFAGQIRPGRLFGDIKPDWRAIKLLASLKLRNAESIFGGIADEFGKCGVHVLPAYTYLEDYLASEGQMGKIGLRRRFRDDVEFGLSIAREVSRLNIGQTVVVRKGTVLAVEGFEGTDAAILRGGELGREEVVVVKVAKPGQDMRFDIPCIGMRTVESLKSAGAAALCVQTGKTLFIEKERVLAALDEAKIAVVGRAGASTP